ncbi:glycosyltransferase family 2 protein [Tenacibaculum sp. TC6]|uniref:glycosyltransferase family 2 protein n=1 Tax=Tenacibaculum sp. TC6 TaxID=3423223 RepID=UPI003D35DDD7
MDCKKVYIIILNYNSFIDTIECLESVFKLEYANFQVIVVDNNSNDNSVAQIIDWANGKSFFEVATNYRALVYPLENKPFQFSVFREGNSEITEDKLVILKAQNNNGFSAGNNIGIQYIQNREDFKYCWILNNDTVVDKKSLKELVENYRRHENLGILGSKLLYYYNPDIIQAIGGKLHKKLYATSHIGEGKLCTINKSNFEKIDFAIGASMFVSKEFLNTVGLLSEDYFLYYEEIDWAFRAKEFGFITDWCEDSIVYHKEGKTTGSSSDYRKRSVFSEIQIFKSRKIFFQKYPKYKFSFWVSSYLIILNRVRRKQLSLAKEFIKILHKRK